MKKYLALLLALVLAFGVLTACGSAPAEAPAAPAETPAAEAPAETPAAAAPAETPAAPVPSSDNPYGLRPGKTAEVSSAADFYEAYADICNPNGKYNLIQLAANVTPNGKMEKFPEGVDTSFVPFLSSNTYICVRMPEGTAIDLNGFVLTLRTIQGMDDNFGGPSGKVTLGTVYDSFGGGELHLNSWLDDQHLQIGIQLANDYAEYARQIIITQGIKDAPGHSYVIPENCALRLTNDNSSLFADSITLKSGATLEVTEKAQPLGITETKAIIFECKNEADHTRKGIEYATEIKDVN